MKNNFFNKLFIVLLSICIGTIKSVETKEILKNTIINELQEGFARIKKQSESDDAFDENIALIECILQSSLIPHTIQTNWTEKSMECGISLKEIRVLQEKELLNNAESAPLSLEEQLEIVQKANKEYSFIIIEGILETNKKNALALSKRKMDEKTNELGAVYDKLYFIKAHLKGLWTKLKINQYLTQKKIIFKTLEDIDEYRKKQDDFFERQVTFYVMMNSVFSYILFPEREREEDEAIKSLCALKDTDEIKKLNEITLDQIVDKIGIFLDNALKNDKSNQKDIKKDFMEFLYGGLIHKYELDDIIKSFKKQEKKHKSFKYIADHIEAKILTNPDSIEFKMHEMMKKGSEKDDASYFPILFFKAHNNYLIKMEIDRHPKDKFKYDEAKIQQYLDNNLILNFFHPSKSNDAIVKKMNCYFKEHKALGESVIKELKDNFSEIEKKSKNDNNFNKDIAIIECILKSSLTPKQPPVDMFTKSLSCNMNHKKYFEIRDREVIKLAQEEPFTLTEKIELLKESNKDFNFKIINNVIHEFLKSTFFDSDYFKNLSSKGKELKKADNEINFIKSSLASILLVLKINQYGKNRQIYIKESDNLKTLMKRYAFNAFEYQLIGFLDNYFRDNSAMLFNNDLIQSLVALKYSAEVKALKDTSLDHIIIKLGEYFNKNLNNDDSIELAFMQTVYGKEIFRYELQDIIDSLRKNKDSCEAFIDMADYIEKEMTSEGQKIVDRFNETRKDLLTRGEESWSPFPFILFPAWREYLIKRATKAYNISNENDLKEYLQNTVIFNHNITKTTQMILVKIDCYVEEYKQDDVKKVSSKGLMHIKSAEEYRKIRLRHKNDVYLVKVGAMWCPPCRMFEKVMEEYSKNKPKINLYSIDQDEVSGIVNEISLDQEKEIIINSIPAIFLMKGGRIIKKAAGSMNLENLNKFIDEELNKKN